MVSSRSATKGPSSFFTLPVSDRKGVASSTIGIWTPSRAIRLRSAQALREQTERMNERTFAFITILLGCLGWLFTHVVERVVDSPTIEFTVNEEDRGGQNV